MYRDAYDWIQTFVPMASCTVSLHLCFERDWIRANPLVSLFGTVHACIAEQHQTHHRYVCMRVKNAFFVNFLFIDVEAN